MPNIQGFMRIGDLGLYKETQKTRRFTLEGVLEIREYMQDGKNGEMGDILLLSDYNPEKRGNEKYHRTSLFKDKFNFRDKKCFIIFVKNLKMLYIIRIIYLNTNLGWS